MTKMDDEAMMTVCFSLLLSASPLFSLLALISSQSTHSFLTGPDSKPVYVSNTSIKFIPSASVSVKCRVYKLQTTRYSAGDV